MAEKKFKNEPMRQAPPDAVVVVDDVAEHLHSQPIAGNWMQDVPVLLPPFESTFIECRRPKTFTGFLFEEWGVSTAIFKDSKAVEFAKEWAERDRRLGNSLVAVPADIKFSVVGFLYINDKRFRLFDRIATLFLPLNNLGGTSISIDGTCLFTKFNDAFWDGFLDGWVNAGKPLHDGQSYIFEHIINPMLAPLFRGIGVMNCKNVTLVDNPPPPKLSKRHLKERGVPLVTYKTINVKSTNLVHYIQPSDQILAPIETKMPLHEVRGTFADYRHGKGLFGKESLKGIYWKPSHVRGDIEHGAVVKDYNVLPK